MPTATPTKWVLQQIFNVDMFDIATGEAVEHLTDLKNCTLTMEGETVYAQGGVSNAKILGFSRNKAARLEMESAVYSNNMLGLQLGNAPTIAANNNYMATDIIVSSSATAATLTYTPDTGTNAPSATKMFVYKLNDDGTLGTKFTFVASAPTGNQFSVSSKALTFPASTFSGAGVALVAYYYVATPATTTTFVNRSDKSAQNVKIVASSLVRAVDTAKDFAAQLILPKAKIDENFSLSIAAEGDPTVHNFSCEALKSGINNTLWELIIADQSSFT